MAEFIPLDYRLKAVSRQRMERWGFFGVIVLAICGAILSSAYALQLRSASELNHLRDEQKARASLLGRSEELHGKRVDLAERMDKIQRLMDDRILLGLLHDISQGFTENDRLETVHIELSGNKADANKADGGKTADEQINQARLTGITTSSATLAELMTRLGHTGKQPIEVRLENSHREVFIDGQVMRFQLLCVRPATSKS